MYSTSTSGVPRCAQDVVQRLFASRSPVCQRKFPDPRMASPSFPRRFRGGPVGVGGTDNRRNPRKSENVCSTRFHNILQFRFFPTVLCPMEQNTVRWPATVWCGAVEAPDFYASRPLFWTILVDRIVNQSPALSEHPASTFNCLPTFPPVAARESAVIAHLPDYR